MSRCYKKFIADHTDTWKDILEVYELTEVTKSSQMTISQRAQTFDRFCRKISALVGPQKSKSYLRLTPCS
jgi:hypothetical protein